MGLTMEIKRSLEMGEYNDPAQVRKLLKSGSFTPSEFKDSLWAAILAAFPCPKEEGIPNNLTAAKQKVWKQMQEEAPELSDHELIFTKCQTSNLCMQCECKKKLISFFEEIGSGSADTIRHRLTSWLTGKVRNLDRLTYIQLCFGLNMRVNPSSTQLTDEEKMHDANRFLTLCGKQSPLYTMKPEEAVYYYCLANPQERSNVENWKYACELIEKLDSVKAEETEDDMYTMFASSVMEGIHTEAQLFDFIAKNRYFEHEMYATAKENCRLLFEQFKLSADVSMPIKKWQELTGHVQKERTITKKDACRVLDALAEFDENGTLDKDVMGLLEQYEFGDILYSSDKLEELLSDEVSPDRTLLLLTVLAQNCGMRYEAESNTLEESDDLTDTPSFSDYFRSLSALLKNMGMAPLYPRWRMDFIVLYAYHLLQKDVLNEEEADSLSGYIIKALKMVMEENKND